MPTMRTSSVPQILLDGRPSMPWVYAVTTTTTTRTRTESSSDPIEEIDSEEEAHDESFVVGVGENCFLAAAKGKTALLIDTGAGGNILWIKVRGRS